MAEIESGQSRPGVIEPLPDVTTRHATIGAHKDIARFHGAWFRTRVSNLPIALSDKTLALYAAESGVTTDRAKLTADAAAREKYYQWWYGKRHAFLVALRDHIRTYAPGARILFTPVSGEPGPTLDGGIVTDDPTRFPGLEAQPYVDVVRDDLWLTRLPRRGSAPERR